MPPVLGLAAALGYNYTRHRQHRSTICSTVRSTLPAPAFIAAFGVGIYVLARHVLDGYPR